MLHTCHLDLRDARIVNELVSRTGGAELLPILNTDIGGVDTAMLEGGTSRAMLADRANPHPQGFPFHEYAWKVVFLHSLVGRHEGLESPAFGIAARDALLACSFLELTPSQVQAALDAIEDADHGAFHLRHSSDKGRYYASLDASINRALATIRAGVGRDQVNDFVDTAARKILTADNTFQVAHDVTAPEHIPDRKGDKIGRPTIGMIALGIDEIDPDAFVTTAGANRPRNEQNHVFLLLPRVVHPQGEIWREDRVARARRDRFDMLDCRTFIRRQLRVDGVSRPPLTSCLGPTWALRVVWISYPLSNPVGQTTAMQHACKPTLYEQLEALPEGLTGEILNGQLHAQQRPAGPHALTESNLQIEIGGPFGKGRGGPGGWWILVEPEVHFVTDREVVVPDLAGWRRERMPQVPQGHRFEVIPDWVCEILSPSTASKDREIKMPIYAHYGVSYAWLIDPKRRSLEAYRPEDGDWRLLAEASENDSIAVAPFDALKLDLSSLWS